MAIQTLGLDIGKVVFHAVGLDAHGAIVFRRVFRRAALLQFIVTLPPCVIGLEACGGAHHLGRRFEQAGHQVRLLPPQYVKPYRKTNKSDFLDAEAIAEAVTRPTMRSVPIKAVTQQELQALHRLRSLWVRHRTAMVNQTRALLLEQGVVVPRGIEKLRRALPEILEDGENGLSPRLRALVAILAEQLRELDQRIAMLTQELYERAAQEPDCVRLMTVPGVGPLTASAMVAAVGDGSMFRRGRHFAAWLGLVPRQSSTGGKVRLLGISKRGNVYLRALFVHGARSVLRGHARRADALGSWLRHLHGRAHYNVAAVALANKLARTAWAVLIHQDEWRAERAVA